MYGLGVNKLGVTNTSHDILRLFANGEQGAWYDPSDLSSLKQNSDGTVDAAVGQPVGYVGDKSGNGNNAIQATSARRPVLREAGGLYYLEFDGSGGLQVASLDLTATDELTHFTGHTKTASTDNAILLEHSSSAVSGNGTFAVSAPQNSTNHYLIAARGTVRSSDAVTSATYAGAFTAVTTVTADISGDLIVGRINGTEVVRDTGNMGDGNFADEPFNIGARNAGATLQFTGFLYQLLVRGKVSSTSEITSTEQYVAEKTGVSL